MVEPVAVEALVSASRTLTSDSRRELARRLVEDLVVEEQDHHDDLHPVAARRKEFVTALRRVSHELGRCPTTTEYGDERRRLLSLGEPLPSVSAIVKAFGGWPKALIAAGLVPAAHPSSFQRRQTYRRQRIHCYTPERLRECLRACARDLGRTPMVRDYAAWREHVLSGPRTLQTAAPDVPHYRTYYMRFGSWAAALQDAGLDGTRRARTQTNVYSPLSVSRKQQRRRPSDRTVAP